jgi:predicted permease
LATFGLWFLIWYYLKTSFTYLERERGFSLVSGHVNAARYFPRVVFSLIDLNLRLQDICHVSSSLVHRAEPKFGRRQVLFVFFVRSSVYSLFVLGFLAQISASTSRNSSRWIDFCTPVLVGFAPREVSCIQRFLSCFFFLVVICFGFWFWGSLFLVLSFERMMNVKP